MNKKLFEFTGTARGFDGIVKPITDMAANLRELQKAKLSEAADLRVKIAELSCKIEEAEAEAQRAGSVATQLEGVVL